MAEKTDPAARAIAAVHDINPSASHISVTFVHNEFLDGHLYVVKFKENEEFFENYVYIEADEIHVNKNIS
ncbi:MAG TPA: hypothetical protein VHS31_09425, partial [Tepidisphaeraceae bacterium]|nr:hypothetical protein [Tepidisphaeraceae bacterium]